MKQSTLPPSIPRPLVRTNQWVIVLSVITTWISGQMWFLLIPLLSGLGGLFFNFNPIMRVAKLFLRKPLMQYIPEEKGQQKFNQVIASVCLTGGFVSGLSEWTVLFYIFTIMVALAAAIAICGFCIGCFILFQWKQYQYRRRSQA